MDIYTNTTTTTQLDPLVEEAMRALERERQDRAEQDRLDELHNRVHMITDRLTDEYGPRPSAPLPPLETIVKKVPGAENLPSFAVLQQKPVEEQKKVEAPALENGQKKKRLKISQKRIKQALTLEFLRRDVTGNPCFYRYVRLPDKNTKPGKTVYHSPKGGACLLIVNRGVGQVRFSFAICSDNDTFIKDEARKLCQNRWRNGITTAMDDMTREASIFDNFIRAYENMVYNVNREQTEPKLHTDPKVNLYNLRKLYKLIKYHIQTGGISCPEAT